MFRRSRTFCPGRCTSDTWCRERSGSPFTKTGGNTRSHEEEWVVVENTHEPLIDRETFDKVQELCPTQKCGIL